MKRLPCLILAVLLLAGCSTNKPGVVAADPEWEFLDWSTNTGWLNPVTNTVTEPVWREP